jgi:hypothetical protein
MNTIKQKWLDVRIRLPGFHPGSPQTINARSPILLRLCRSRSGSNRQTAGSSAVVGTAGDGLYFFTIQFDNAFELLVDLVQFLFHVCLFYGVFNDIKLTHFPKRNNSPSHLFRIRGNRIAIKQK